MLQCRPHHTETLGHNTIIVTFTGEDASHSAMTLLPTDSIL